MSKEVPFIDNPKFIKYIANTKKASIDYLDCYNKTRGDLDKLSNHVDKYNSALDCKDSGLLISTAESITEQTGSCIKIILEFFKSFQTLHELLQDGYLEDYAVVYEILYDESIERSKCNDDDYLWNLMRKVTKIRMKYNDYTQDTTIQLFQRIGILIQSVKELFPNEDGVIPDIEEFLLLSWPRMASEHLVSYS